MSDKFISQLDICFGLRVLRRAHTSIRQAGFQLPANCGTHGNKRLACSRIPFEAFRLGLALRPPLWDPCSRRNAARCRSLADSPIRYDLFVRPTVALGTDMPHPGHSRFLRSAKTHAFAWHQIGLHEPFQAIESGCQRQDTLVLAANPHKEGKTGRGGRALNGPKRTAGPS